MLDGLANASKLEYGANVDNKQGELKAFNTALQSNATETFA